MHGGGKLLTSRTLATAALWLQPFSLLHTREFCGYLANNHNACSEPPHKCVSCALRVMLSWHWPYFEMGEVRNIPTPSDDALEPLYNAICKTVYPVHDLFGVIDNLKQGDSADVVNFLIDELREEEGRTDALIASNPYKISNLFDIEHETEWICATCSKVHRRGEQTGEAGHGAGITVNIQAPARHLISMMTYLRSNEYMEQMEIRCDSESCVSNRQRIEEAKDTSNTLVADEDDKLTGTSTDLRTRRKYIIKAPEVLVIKLARFTAMIDEEGKLKTEKLSDTIKYPSTLDLTEFTRPSGPPSDDSEAQQVQSLRYKLQGVVAHGGDTIDKGHFVAVVRELDGPGACLFNDDMWLQGGLDMLQRPRDYWQEFDPYLLFYSKVDDGGL